MPFCKWAVEPVYLSREPLPPDKKCLEFEAVTNGSLVQCLRQLSSVAKIADRIFDEISCEFRLVAERAERLKAKVESCREVVSKFNARAVKVPVSDLCEASNLLRRRKPYRNPCEPQTQLFLPSNRPPCVDRLYQGACATPVALVCDIDRYRTDGLTASQLFMVTPVLGGGEGRKKRRRNLDIETRKPANCSLVHEQDEDSYDLSSFSALVVSPSIGGNLRQNASRELERLPSPEEQALCTSLEYPSTVIPVDTSGHTFSRMSLFRRSLIHVDFVIKRKKDKRKSKQRRHTVCEGDSREIEKAVRDISVAHSSCQTDDLLTDSRSTTLLRSLSKRRSRSTLDNSRRKSSDLELDSLKQLCKNSEENLKDNSKKSRLSTIKSRALNFNPLSSISAAITMAAVKMRQSSRTGKQDDGRSSSGNWSASSSTRASVDSDHHHATTPGDSVSSPSRNSVGKDSLLSDITHHDQHNRSRDDIPVQPLSKSPTRLKRYTPVNPPWSFNPFSSNTPTPDPQVPTVKSPYAGRKGTIDDEDSSVYSVDTDGYYTSMHTDSGLWNLQNLPKPSELNGDGYRVRRESQSSVSTIGNSSINSFLSNKSATECSSTSSSLKKRRSVIPKPPPRTSSCTKLQNDEEPPGGERLNETVSTSEKSDSPQPLNGSASESDFDVGDRIRAKTVISSFRYPSMCAVSPETSDDEIGDWTASNVVVAEVHREEEGGRDRHNLSEQSDVPIAAKRLSGQGINMYRSETPVQSSFFSKVGHQVTTSTPRSGIAISTFSPDLQDFSDTSTNKTGSSEDLKCLEDGLIVTQDPVSPLAIGSGDDKSLIPLKYAQHITVTPIARSNTPTTKHSRESSPKPSFVQQLTRNFTGSSLERQSPSKVNSLSSYVSYKPPDSPISSTGFFIKPSSSVPNSPTGSLSRPVARVTLDPSGKVVFSSNSLERNGSQGAKQTINSRGYNTLPTYQSPVMENGMMMSSKIPTPKYQSVRTNIDADGYRSNFKIQQNNCIAASTISNTEVSHAIPNTSTPVLNTFATPSSLNKSFAPSGKNPILSHSETASSTAEQEQNHSPQISSGRDFNFRPSRGGRLCRSYFPSHLISQSNQNSTKRDYSSLRHQTVTDAPPSCIPLSNLYRSKQYSPVPAPASPQVPSYYNKSSSFSQHPINNNNSPSSAVPKGPLTCNYSIPQLRAMQHNTDTSVRHAIKLESSKTDYNPYAHTAFKDTEHDMNASKSFMSKPPDLIPSGSSPPSTLDITSTQSKADRELKTMSATELFAIIHSSAKKHRINTESEKSSSPMSSRSASPALSQTSVPSRMQPVETGFLSKRGSTPSSSSPSSLGRRQAPDKIAKHTSMRDFKMLLLQARTGGRDSSPRPSAAELLKVSPPKTQTIVLSPLKSPVSSFSPNVITVKRNRARSPYLARYDNAYPPILEDRSEDMESHQDSNCLRGEGSSQATGTVAKATSTWV